MDFNPHPKVVGKPMPKGTGDQIVIEFIDHDDQWIFNAMWRGLRAGYAWCTLTEKRLHIGAFIVEEALHVPLRHEFLNNLRSLLNIPCSRKNFRGHGIGSKLMDA